MFGIRQTLFLFCLLFTLTSGQTCSAHNECPQDAPFCYLGECDQCDQCHYCDEGIDNTCGSCGKGYPTQGWPCVDYLVVNQTFNATNGTGQFFGFNFEDADAFFGTSDWHMSTFSVIASNGLEGIILVWKNNPMCNMSCGQWNDSDWNESGVGNWAVNDWIIRQPDSTDESPSAVVSSMYTEEVVASAHCLLSAGLEKEELECISGTEMFLTINTTLYVRINFSSTLPSGEITLNGLSISEDDAMFCSQNCQEVVNFKCESCDTAESINGIYDFSIMFPLENFVVGAHEKVLLSFNNSQDVELAVNLISNDEKTEDDKQSVSAVHIIVNFTAFGCVMMVFLGVCIKLGKLTPAQVNSNYAVLDFENDDI